MTFSPGDPRVSIVVPAYNAIATIAETLASLAAQSYANLEVIIVDDGSSDRTGEIAREAATRSGGKMRYVRQANGGQASAQNNGWRQSAGAYLGYLSADDVLYPDAVATLVDHLERNPTLWVVYPDYDLIDARSKAIRRVWLSEFDARALVEHSLCQFGPGVLFRREAFELTGGWNCELRQMPDFDFWVRVSRWGPMARFPQSLAGFRVHEGSQSFGVPSESKSEEPLKIIQAYFEAGNPSGFDAIRAMAWAHVLAARWHLRAGRLRRAFGHLTAALRGNASIAASWRFWHLLANGALGRLRYRLLSSTSTDARGRSS